MDSADPPKKSEKIAAGLDAMKRGARLPQHPVDVPSRPPAPDDLLLNNVIGVKLLRELENRACGPGGTTLNVYSVRGEDADALWRRMLHRASDGELTMAHTEVDGRRIRYLRQSGFDYDVEVAFSQASDWTVLATRGCS